MKTIFSFVIVIAITGGLYSQPSLCKHSVNELFLDGGIALAQKAEYNEDYSTPYTTTCEVEIEGQEKPEILHGTGCNNVNVLQDEICVEILCN